MSSPGTMKAIIFEKFGPASNLKLIQDYPIPKRGPKDIKVKILATSVNPVDYKTRSGILAFATALPKVLGGDVAGLVVEAGQEVAGTFPVGTLVYACTSGFKTWVKDGAYAEFACFPADQAAKMPQSLAKEPHKAAALPLAALTAWQALEAANLQPGQRILIHAGAGGVGSLALQLAKARGLLVTTTCSARNVELVKGLGADEAIDYTAGKFEDAVNEPFDGVIDLIGGDYEARSMSVLKKDGVFVSVMNSGWIKNHSTLVATAMTLYCAMKGKLLSVFGLHPKYHLIMVHPSGEQLAEVAKLVDEGKVQVVIDRILPLEKAAEAHEYMEREHARGKVILQVA